MGLSIEMIEMTQRHQSEAFFNRQYDATVNVCFCQNFNHIQTIYRQRHNTFTQTPEQNPQKNTKTIIKTTKIKVQPAQRHFNLTARSTSRTN